MEARKESVFMTWLAVGLLLIYFLAYSTFTYIVVGDRGQPNWDYRQVKDVPGESPYAVYGKLPAPQHVRGIEGE